MTLEADSIFLQELRASHEWALWAGLQFLKAGFTVQVPPLQVRPNRECLDNYTDHGDLFVWRSPRDRLRFECKSRRIGFTGRHDYPFDTAFVDRVGTWKRKTKARPAAILLISQETRAIMAIGVWTEGAWIIQTKEDHVRNYTRTYYLAPRSLLLEWHELVNHIKGQLAFTQ